MTSPAAPTDRYLADIWLFYKSEEDPGMWVAHSVQTDQIALGDSVLQAYVTIKRVMRVFWEAYATDPSIKIEPAPKDIRDQLEGATLLDAAFLGRAEELLMRRTIRPPVGTVFKTVDFEPRRREPLATG